MKRRDVLMQFALAASGSIAARLVSAGALHGAPVHKPDHHSALTGSQRAMVSLLAGMIIPLTDTPGAIEAGVPEFIDHIVTDWYTPRERLIFLSGLSDLDTDCVQRFGRKFAGSTTAQQADALSASEARSVVFRETQGNPVMGIQDEPDGESPFFYKLKELTVLGYYTSPLGSTTELNYNPIPGRFDGDVDFIAAGGRQWSS